MEKQYFSKEKLEQLKNELDELKTVKRVEIAEKLLRAKELGDLSENSEYFEAREEQARMEGRIFELEEMLRNVEVIKKKATSTSVQIGSTIEVEKGGKKIEFTIVGSTEANPDKGMISNESPLGKAFLNKKAGEKALVTTPGGQVEYSIITIK
ncbi:MAG: transcription elongation factor GreA [Candidatus Pacebacteria bacterium]|nr:transcription elongation factor GreA [Candidatus Paceibacterota bacterium]